MKKMFRKADFVLLAVLIVVGIAVSAVLSLGSTGGDKVVIKVDGDVYGRYSLSEDKTIDVRQDSENVKYNIVVIKDGTVSVAEASCHNQVCVDHKPISASGESIVCLPNKMIVTIEGKGDEYDSISS